MRPTSRLFVPLALLGACATNPTMDPDPEVPTDAATAAVLRQGAPAPGVQVVFHDAAGLPLAVVVTGADGKAVGPMVAGGMITVPTPRTSGARLDTMIGVKPGETIVFGLPADDVSNDEAGVLHIVSPPVQNTRVYTIDNGCQAMDVSALDPAPELAVGTACVTGGETSVLVIARDSQGLPYSWAGATDVPVTAGAVSSASLTPWSADFTGLSMTVTSLPEHTLGLIASTHAVYRDIPFRALGVPNQVNAYPGASASMILGYPHYGDGLEYMTDLVLGEGDNVTGTSRIVARTAPADRILLDGSQDYLAEIPQVTVDTASPARTTATWSLASSHVVDAALVRIAGASAAGAATWTLMATPDAGTLTTPVLPAELASFTLVSVASTDVALVDDADEASFDEVRRGAGLSLLDRPLRGPSARIRYVLEHRE